MKTAGVNIGATLEEAINLYRAAAQAMAAAIQASVWKPGDYTLEAACDTATKVCEARFIEAENVIDTFYRVRLIDVGQFLDYREALEMARIVEINV